MWVICGFLRIKKLFILSRITLHKTLCKNDTIPILSEEMMGADMRFRNSWAAWNPNQGMCNVLLQKFVVEVCGESFLATV